MGKINSKERIDYYRNTEGMEVRILENYRFDGIGMIWDAEFIGVISDEEMIKLLKENVPLKKREGWGRKEVEK